MRDANGPAQRVYFLDNTSSLLPVSPLELVGELRARVAQTLRLPPGHADCFELYSSRDGIDLGPELSHELGVSGLPQGARVVYAARIFCDGELVGVRRRAPTLRLA
mmetsp:Transcript_25440/g.87293  ORF Transcript_25440/g.87293 Transcript_25440/m.87293 type:complete len:106 (+) Transcript_25440:139-456(+)